MLGLIVESAGPRVMIAAALAWRRDPVAKTLCSHWLGTARRRVAAVAGLEIPPIIDEMVIAVGGPVKVSAYAFPGSEELADSVCEALGPRSAALIKNHGAVGVGRDLREALGVCTLVERVAQIFLLARTLGRVDELPPDVVKAEQAIFEMRRQRDTGL